MPNNANYSSANTERLPSNIMDLRDEDFYHFIKQYSGAKVAELLAFQEYNAVDYFLECNDIAEIFQYNSNALNELKEKTCITLVDGTSILLPGLKSSINNLKKVLKKKREEINKQAKRLQCISTSTPSTTYNTLSISTPVMPSTSLSTVQASSPQIPTPPTSFDNSPTNTQTTFSCVTDQIKNKITKVLSNWLVKDKQDLDLLDTNIKKGIDFQLELNIRQDGISLICNCGTRSSIGHKEKTLVFSNIYRHFKSEKCSWINQRKQNANDNNSDTDDEQDQTSSTPRQPNSRLRTVTFSKGKRPTRSVSTVSTKKRRHN